MQRRLKEEDNKYNATMTQIVLAWQFAKGVAAPIIDAAKAKYFDDAVGALNITLTDGNIPFLEELYVPPKIVGAI